MYLEPVCGLRPFSSISFSIPFCSRSSQVGPSPGLKLCQAAATCLQVRKGEVEGREDMLGDPKGYCQFLPPPLTDVTRRASLPLVRIYHGAHMLIEKQHPSATFPGSVHSRMGPHRGCGQGERSSRCPGRQFGSSCAVGRYSSSGSYS